MNQIIISILVGLLSAIFASLGLGGGTVLLLYLTAAAGMDQLQAQGINLIFFIPIALIALAIHAKSKLIEWKVVWPAVLTGSIGTFLGSFVAGWLGSDLLSKCFAAFLLLLGLKEVFHRRTAKKEDTL